MKKKVTFKTISSAIFCAALFASLCFMGWQTLHNDQKISVDEGRYLARWPQMRDQTAQSILSGEYESALTSAFSDQLYMRKDLTKAYYLFLMLNYSSSVVEGSDNQLFAAPFFVNDPAAKKASLLKAAKKISAVAADVNDAGAEFIFVGIPRKDAVMEEYLPDSYTSSKQQYRDDLSALQEGLAQTIPIVDALELFSKTPDANGRHDYYFTTDHHMNVRGAELIYTSLVERMRVSFPKMPILSLDKDYNIGKAVINGSFNRQIGQKIQADPEELNLTYKNPDEVGAFERLESGAVSDIKVLGADRTYASAYMDGDFPETKVTSEKRSHGEPGSDGAPNVLIVGSSYTNVLEALFIPSTHIMASLDYRDNKTGKQIAEYVREYDIDYVIFIPEQRNDSFSYSQIKEHLGLSN